MNISEVKRLAEEIRHEVKRGIVGQDDAVELMLVALFARATSCSKGRRAPPRPSSRNASRAALGLDFGRIQFTPDLMPGDILGSNLFNFQTSQFTLTRGPIFCELLLADEINRTPPKTQAALLEAMQERAVTIDGETHALPTALHGGRDPEPDRAAGRLSAARGAARPLPVQAPDGLSAASRRRRRIVAGHGARFGAPRSRGLGRRARWPSPPRLGRRRWPPSRAVPLVDEVTDYVVGAGARDPRERPISRPARARARRRCSPAPRGRGRRSTGATM